MVNFINNDQWEHRTKDSHGNEWSATRFVNDQGLQQLVIDIFYLDLYDSEYYILILGHQMWCR